MITIFQTAWFITRKRPGVERYDIRDPEECRCLTVHRVG